MAYKSRFKIFVQLNSFEKFSKKLGFTTDAIKFKPWLLFVYYRHAPVKGAIEHSADFGMVTLLPEMQYVSSTKLWPK